MNPNHIFALDIGTRTVVGLIVKHEKGQYEIVDVLTKEHDERAMLDGQIHDVLAVSNIITDIKQELEEKHGPLRKVSVAAAGRALKTKRATVTIPIANHSILNDQGVLHLELSAVQAAQNELVKDITSTKSTYYDCVGYSVLHYLLDGDEIGSLIDQQGEEATVEVIATFLPRVVVESLLAALERANLEMDALTLEPIAAINVLIPSSMRRLNVALVDIGAGTSDIALTDMGTVIAYGMVPIAGDEITEAMSDEFLLDFPLAEHAKRSLVTDEEITIKDILGIEIVLPKDEVIKRISNSIQTLADAIASEILTLNNNVSPKAVMLVGGGCLTPNLPQLLATKLGLPENRIAIRGIDAIPKLILAEHIKKSPELVTPIGIAIGASQNPIQYVTVTVNDRRIRLFDMKQLTVGDSLLAAGIDMTKLYGKPGMGIIALINDREISIPGGYGSAPTILKNGVATTFDESLVTGDNIVIVPGKSGQSPNVKIGDIVDLPKKEIAINNQHFIIETLVKRNDTIVSTDTVIQDKDRIKTYTPKTIEDVIQHARTKINLPEIHSFAIYINGSRKILEEFIPIIKKNGVLAKPTTSIQNRDKIVIEQPSPPTVKHVLEHMNIHSLYAEIVIQFQKKQVVLKKKAFDIIRNNKELNEESLISTGEKLELIPRKKEQFILQDIFKFSNVDIPTVKKGTFMLLKNGEKANFDEPLMQGDEITILWPHQLSEVKHV